MNQTTLAQTPTVFTGSHWSEFESGAKAVCDDNDIDNDNDGLIEVCSLEMLDAMRWQLDGSGLRAARGTTKVTTGCASGGCKGYEMVRDLDFRDDDSYRDPDENKTRWTSGVGWPRIGNSAPSGRFNAIFEGNGHTLSHLLINGNDSPEGLFAYLVSGKIINGVGLLAVNIRGGTAVGGLAGIIAGTVSNSYVTGEIAGAPTQTGGLVGEIVFGGTITNSYSTAKVSGGVNVGSLAGQLGVGTINNSYSTGQVTGTSRIGGLVGTRSGTVSNSYSTGQVSKTGTPLIGGLVGIQDAGATNNSYWDTDTSGVTISASGEGKTTAELQSPTNNTTGIYSAWSDANWDFGTAIQYPALKYVTDANADYQTCGTSQQPTCGSLLAGQRTRLQIISTATDVRFEAVEGETVTLDATRSGTNLTYAWEQTDGRNVSYLSTADSAMLRFLVPPNVASGGATATGVLMFHLTVNGASATTVSIVVYDNSDDGSITTLTITRLPARKITASADLASDPDGAGRIEAYQWQICSPTCSQWQDALGASTNSSYQIPVAEVAVNDQFRVQLTYRDGQNFQRTLPSAPLIYTNQNPMITDIDPITTTEGEVVTLVAEASDADFDNLNYLWRATTGDKTASILKDSTVTSATLVFTVPTDWASTTQATLSLSFSVSDGATTSTKPAIVTIARADNGGLTTTTPTITEVEQKLTVSPISVAALATDPDGAGTVEAYQWQICLANLPKADCSQQNQWQNISDATNNSYQIPQAEAIVNNQFRVQITYRDRQSYRRTVTSEALSYPQKAIFMRLKLFLEGALQ